LLCFELKGKLDQSGVVAVWLTVGKHTLTPSGVVSDAKLPVL
jgi:hypothetical protein